MLDIRDATVYYQSGVQGVDNLNLHVDDGEFCFITGASGSGKLTLSKLITGELQPDVGTVRVNGYNMSALDSKTMAEARRTIGMVFQDFRLITSMTVSSSACAGNLMCCGARQRRSRRRSLKRLPDSRLNWKRRLKRAFLWTPLSLSLTSLKRPFEKILKTLLTAILIWCTLYLY